MNIISLSILYLWPKPFNYVLKEISNKIDCENAPDAWDILDEGAYSLAKKYNLIQYRRLKESGVNFTVHAPFLVTDYLNPNYTTRRKSISRLKSSIENAAQLSPLAYVFHPTTVPKGYSRDTLKVEHYHFLEEIMDFSRSLGLTVFLENHVPGMGHMFTDPEEFIEFYKRTGSSLGLAFDVGHANIGSSVKRFLDLLVDRIGAVHVHDNDGTSDSHKMIGSGTVNWKYVISKLRTSNFRGPYIIECVQQPFTSLQILRNLLSCKP
ncbi:MAG: sugar phosphate isomerase/epimerase [Nitrososphaeria archaeon]|nr:sugar phosphate isomerase/epimerase [Nitrososphaeria archaeon]